jgi:GWxTD domain-containing protein
MRVVSIIVICAVMIWSGCGTGADAYRECYSITQFKRLQTPAFDQYFMNVRGNDKSRIDVYTQLPYWNIRFQKKGDVYSASYTMKIIIRDSSGAIVRTTDADRPIEAGTYEISVSRRYDLFLQSFQFEPGRYTFEIESFDNLSKYRSRTVTSVIAADLSTGTVRAGSPLFLNTMRSSESGITLRPVLPSDLSALNDSIGIFQEIYNCSLNDTIRIIQQFIGPQEFPGTEPAYPRMMPPYRMSTTSCATEAGVPYFSAETLFTVKNEGTVRSILFYPLPSAGHSLLRRHIIVTHNGRNDTLSGTTGLFRREKRAMNTIALSEEIAVLRFIIQKEMFDSLIIGDAISRNREIAEFWEERGGTERRKEFLRRIAEANMLFTGCTDGSKTPMGIISVICGTPDLIECNGDYAETWYYTIGERSYPVQFRKIEGAEPLYEIEPFSMSDVLWQYSLDLWRRKR